MASSVENGGTIHFRCNICGSYPTRPRAELQRETVTCDECTSSVRTRAVIRMLSREIFGVDLALPDFPRLRGIRGLGISDSADYALRLPEKFDYRNTEYDREPCFDILNPPDSEIGTYDFVLCSEVLEHVVAPIDVAFTNIYRLLKPHGLLLMTVPYGFQDRTIEHFGPMKNFSIATFEDRAVLIRRGADGRFEVLDNLVFHGGTGSTLEMRIFSESELRATLAAVGFSSVAIHGQDYPDFGICHNENWSLPIAARKQPFIFDHDSVRSWAEQWRVRVADHGELAGRYATAQQQALELRRSLESQIGERTEWVLGLERQVDERTAWALSLDQQLEAERKRIAALQAEIAIPFHQRVVRKLKRLARL